jgi:hypothetical protein
MEFTTHVVAKPFRTSINESGASLYLSVPNEWSWIVFCWHPIWLVFWAFALRFIFRDFWPNALQRQETFELVFLTAWTGFWAWAGLMAFIQWLGNFSGSKTLSVDSTGFSYRHEVLSIGYSRFYKGQKIRNLRYLPRTHGRGAKANGLGFDYGRGTKRLFTQLTRPEIEGMVEQITMRFPQFSGESTQ